MLDDRVRRLREEEGLSFAQIAGIVGGTKDAVQKQYRRRAVSVDGPSSYSFADATPDAFALARTDRNPRSGPDQREESGVSGFDTRSDPDSLADYVGFSICFADLETTDLKGNFGRLLAGCGVDGFGRLATFRKDEARFKGKTPIDDSKLAVAIRDYIESFDILVTWNGKLFDVPFLNGRLRIAGERPLRDNIMHLDLMYYATGIFVRIGSRRLENVAKVFHCANQKTPLVAETWALATAGDLASLDNIVEHCEADVLVLRDVFRHLRPFVKNLHR